MKVIFTWSELIVLNGTTEVIRYPASCKVRTELNGQRRKDQTVLTVPTTGHPKPYYPRQFPSGIHEIIGIEYTEDEEYAPVKIKTTALREVFTWDLDREGKYWKPTGNTQEDTAYWLHYTKSNTTLGCIRIGSELDALSLAHLVEGALDKRETVLLEVL